MAAYVEPAVPANIYTDDTAVKDLLGVCGVNLRLNDSETTVVTVGELLRLTKIIYVASGIVDMFLNNRYDPADLVTNWVVRDWATVIAAYKLTMRRCGNVPTSLQWEYEQAVRVMRDIQLGLMQIGGLASVSGPGISVSNMRVNPRYPVNQLRVEPSLSDSTPAQYPQKVDTLNYGVGPGGLVPPV